MRPGIDVPEDTRARQQLASRPQASAWVSANAGSGKTHVLTQRVVRLLLEDVPPARILCLTFTKAAAANMSIRVFETLAGWTALSDADLADAIKKTGAPPPSAAGLIAARRLFARTVETPGGLKIQTIHAFCERLLHLFPFEANVAARFEVLDERMSDELLEHARVETLEEAVREPESRLGEAVAFLARDSTAATFEMLLGEALNHRVRLGSPALDLRGSAPDALYAALGLTAGETPGSVGLEMLEGGMPRSEWLKTAAGLGADETGRNTTANRLAAAAQAEGDAQFERYLDVFLTAERAARADSYLPAKLRNAAPDLTARLDRERDRIGALLTRYRAAQTSERTAALLTVARAVLARYADAKRRRGLLDFDDLVERTRTLLRSAGANWVLYKLDGGIDHVLVDEAQDTSPVQWEILRALTSEFFAGEGRPGPTRTFFAVGDEKQSIFSFQGARPAMFAAMRGHFAAQAQGANTAFHPVDLNLSFRSSQIILDTVDRVFAVPAHAEGLSAEEARPPSHVALHAKLPGLVQLWPAIGEDDPAQPRDWRLPVDQADPHSPPVVLARRIAKTISALLDPTSRETVAEGSERRPVRAGDIMVLVRSRGAFFEAVIRALKDGGVPVAGADRLVLTDHIAVLDLVAVGRASLLPEDDLTVACVLKSPLIGLDDEDLMALAPHRTKRLVDALAHSSEPRHREAAERLGLWRQRATILSPFAFFARLLGADRGRQAMLARLGPEAGDALDEFLSLALAYEREEPPSLLGFLARLEGESLSIKRDMEAAGDAVRVMTVHAAKGLEARIVFLPDTCSAPSGRHDPRLFVLGDTGSDPASGHLAWSPRKELDAPAVGAARMALQQAAREENNRLLYVALTRAAERLYIAGFHGTQGIKDGSWYAMIAASDLGLTEAPAPWDASDTVRERRASGLLASVASAPGLAQMGRSVPDWLFRQPPGEVAYAPPVRPSNPLAAADQQPFVSEGFDADRDSTRRHAALAGRLAHGLLQHLPSVPPVRRRETAVRLARPQLGTTGEAQVSALIDDVLAVLTHPDLIDLFGPSSRAEVALAGRARLADGRVIEITGQIDRIGLGPGTVLIADFKTGRPHDLATLPHAYVAQLALYRAAVAQLYPDRQVRAFLVFTAAPARLEIPPERLDAALAELAGEAFPLSEEIAALAS